MPSGRVELVSNGVQGCYLRDFGPLVWGSCSLCEKSAPNIAPRSATGVPKGWRNRLYATRTRRSTRRSFVVNPAQTPSRPSGPGVEVTDGLCG